MDWTVVRQAPLSMGFPKQDYWSGLPFPPLRDFPTVSCVDRRVPYHWTTWEALKVVNSTIKMKIHKVFSKSFGICTEMYLFYFFMLSTRWYLRAKWDGDFLMTCYVSGHHASVSRMQYQLLWFCLAYVEIHTMEKFFKNNAAAAKSLQSCPTLCDPIDGNPPGSSVPRILHARILEWVAISFYIRQNCFLYKNRILVISCQYNMPWGEIAPYLE